MKTLNKFVISITLIMLCCCTDYLGDFPETEQKHVVNAMLCVDSTVVVDLTLSNAPKTSSFTFVPNATMDIINDKNVIPLTYDEQKGYYKSDYKLKSACDYQLNIETFDKKKLSAKAYVPRKSNLSIKQTENNSYSLFEIKLCDIDEKINAIYIYMYEYIDWTQYKPESKPHYHPAILYCKTPTVDQFNRFRDDLGPQGYIYSYDAFVRAPVEAALNQQMILKVASMQVDRILIIEATEEWDYYYKAAFLQRYFDPEINLPFTYESINLPSNIDGGAGIFAGTAVHIYDVKKD